MPQLLPFYFLNQICFIFFALGVLIFLFSKYILPTFVQLFISRMYISTLLI